MKKENIFEYQTKGEYVAQCGRELESLVEEELPELGAEPMQKLRGGVLFRAGPETLYRVNYCSALISRVLAPLATFPCVSEKELYDQAVRIPWEKILTPSTTFAITSQVSSPHLPHSQFAALRVKDAIVDYFRKKTGSRPSVDRRNPDIWINLNVQGEKGVIGLDTSGGPLHRRGYRLYGGEAPIQETLAAAIIRLSDWSEEQPLHDPMCGSGTLLAEALLRYCRVPPGFKRPVFGFQRLPDYDPCLWINVKNEADHRIRNLPAHTISGSDMDVKILRAAKANISHLPGGAAISLTQSDFRTLPGLDNFRIVCNLPYGVRSGEKEKLASLYKEFGDFMKQRCLGAIAYLLVGDLDLIPAIGLKPSRRIPLFNGSIECRLLKFEIY